MNKWIFGRVACLGIDSFNLTGINAKLINVQKGRIDLLIDKESTNFSILKFVNVIKRKDIKYLIFQQILGHRFVLGNPEFILLDSYSELTDQLFRFKNGGSCFFANYTDVDIKNKDFLNFGCEGLIDLSLVKNQYISLFNRLNQKYSFPPIIYIHFPFVREPREHFTNRARILIEIMTDLQLIYSNLFLINVPLSLANIPTDDDFPYHYSQEVYRWVSQEINNIYNACK
jgi:hypothetical protein